MRNFLTGRSEPKQDKNATVEQRMSVMIKNEDILEANQLWENIQYTEQSGEKVNAGDIKKIQKNVIDQNLDMDIILQQQLINTSPYPDGISREALINGPAHNKLQSRTVAATTLLYSAPDNR